MIRRKDINRNRNDNRLATLAKGKSENNTTPGYLKKKNEITASSASMKEPLNSSGTRKSRSFASAVSRTARPKAKTPSLSTSAKTPMATTPGLSVTATPQGKKMFPSNVRNRNNFINDAHSINARYRPEYSKIMASWIMVRSRCEEGMSTGNRPVSARATMK